MNIIVLLIIYYLQIIFHVRCDCIVSSSALVYGLVVVVTGVILQIVGVPIG